MLMKNYFIAMSLILGSLTMQGQSPAVSAIVDAYRHAPEVETVSVGGVVLNMVSWFIEEPTAKMIIKKTRKVRIMTAPDRRLFHPDDMTAFMDDIFSEGYEKILQIREDGNIQNIYARMDNYRIRNVLIFVDEADQFVLLGIKCNLKYDDLVELLNEAI